MTVWFRERAKSQAGHLAGLAPQARFERAVLVLSHMRSASTALTNVLCSHPSTSGYGETHIVYQHRNAPGRVLVNLMLRRAFKPRAPFFVDKLLHNRLDEKAPPDFFKARGLFIARAPGSAIQSIQRLAAKTDMRDVANAEAAARYFADRLEHLATLWDRFASEQRFGLTSEALLSDPDNAIAEIGSWLGFRPQLENRYISKAASQRGGGGDPTKSARHTRIEKVPAQAPPLPIDTSVPKPLRERCHAAHEAMVARFSSAVDECGGD